MAVLPEILRELARERVGRFLVLLRGDDHAHAGLCRVAEAEIAEHRNIENRRPQPRLSFRDRFAVRSAVAQERDLRREDRQLYESLCGAHAAKQRLHGEAGLVPALNEVDVRGRQIRDEEISLGHHLTRNVRMEVERRDDRHARADDRAYRGEQRALGIRVDGAARRPMSLDVNPVERQRRFHSLRDHPEVAVEESLVDRAARAGRGHGERYRRPWAGFVHSSAEPAKAARIARRRRARVVKDRLAFEPVLLPELRLVRDRREGVRFEHEADERDARRHSHLLDATAGAAATLSARQARCHGRLASGPEPVPQSRKVNRESLMATTRRAIVGGGLAAGALAASPAIIRARAAVPASRTLRAVMHGDLRSFDPVWTTAVITIYHGAMVYDTLFGMDAGMRPRPQMLSRVAVSEDRKTYTFELREGLVFPDGSPVTAADCVASVRRWAARDGGGQHLFLRVLDTPVRDE